jgi:hypothetical protein
LKNFSSGSLSKISKNHHTTINGERSSYNIERGEISETGFFFFFVCKTETPFKIFPLANETNDEEEQRMSRETRTKKKWWGA